MRKIVLSLFLLVMNLNLKSQVFLFADKIKWEEIALFYAELSAPEEEYLEKFEIRSLPLDNKRDTISYEKYNHYRQLEYSVKTNLVGWLYYVGKVYYPDTISLYQEYDFDTELSIRNTFYHLDQYTSDSVLSYYDESKGIRISKYKKSADGTYDIETKIKFLDHRSTLLINYYDMNDGWRLVTTRRYEYKNFRYYFVPIESK